MVNNMSLFSIFDWIRLTELELWSFFLLDLP